MILQNLNELMEYITDGGKYVMNNDAEKLIQKCNELNIEVTEFFTHWEDSDFNVYQYFNVLDNDNLQKYLQLKDAPLPVFYIEDFDLYFIGGTVFGMSYRLADCNVEIKENN